MAQSEYEKYLEGYKTSLAWTDKLTKLGLQEPDKIEEFLLIAKQTANALVHFLKNQEE